MSTRLRFGAFEVDLAAGHLFKNGARLPLREQSLQVLALLLEHPGEVVSREAVRRRLWPAEVFVDFENSINTAVARLREALGDSAERQRVIETLPRRGYRFIGTVSAVVPGPSASQAARSRLLVLPFVNASGDPSQEYLCDAITDDLITELAVLAADAVGVVARTTAMRYKGSRRDVVRIGRELGVDYVVEGSVRSTGDSALINVQLVRASDRSHVWAHRYEVSTGELAGIFASIAQEVGAALHVPPPDSVRRPTVEARRTRCDPVAYDHYVRGLRCLDGYRSREDYDRAMRHLESALAREPGFAPAHEALGELYWILTYVGLLAPKEAFAVGILHVVRALEIDDTRAFSYALLSQYRKQFDYAWQDVHDGLVRARRMDPTSPNVKLLHVIGWLMPQGHLDEGITELESARERDPQSGWIHVWLGVMRLLARQWELAIAQGRLLIDMEPTSPAGEWIVGAGLRGKGRGDDAVAAHGRAVALSGGAPMMLGWLGLSLGANGQTHDAREVLERLQVLSGEGRYVPPTTFAWVHLGLGDVGRAFEWLDRAVDARDQLLMPIKSYAFLDPLRCDPRFSALLRKMNLNQ